MALHTTNSTWRVAPSSYASKFTLDCSCVKSSLSPSFVGLRFSKLSVNPCYGTQAVAIASSPKAFVEKEPDSLSSPDHPSGNLEKSSESTSNNLKRNGGHHYEREELPRKSWKSRTGRNSRKKHGDRMTSILEVVNSEGHVERGLESLKVKLNTREQSVILNEQKDWSRALAIFGWLKNQTSYSPNVIHYNIILKILGRAQQWEFVERIWAEMLQQKIIPTNVTFSTLIDVYDRAGKTQKALQWLEIMKSRGLQADTVTANTVLNVHKRHGNVAAAEEIFENLRSPHTHLKETDVKNDSRQMKDNTFPEKATHSVANGDVGTYNAMIDMYGKAGRFADASRVFSDMMESAVPPDAVTFNTMIKVCGLAGRIQEAEAMYLKMEESGTVSDLATFNILVAIFCKEGKFSSALDYFENMKAKGIEPDEVSYHTLLSALAAKNQLNDVELILQEMQELGLAPDEGVSVGVVLMYVRLGLIDKASKIITKFQGEELHARTSYAAIIDAYGEQKLWYEAEKMFVSCRGKWTVEICNTMMKAYGLAGLHDKAVDVLTTLEESGLVPDETTFNTLLHSLVAIVPSNVEKVKQIRSKMWTMNCKVKRSTFNLLIGFYAKLGLVKEAEETFKQMKAAGVAPDGGSYAAVLNAYAEVGLVEEAQHIVVDMKEAGFPANHVVLTTLMKAYGRAGKPEEAKRILMDIERQRGEPDLFATNLLIDLYARDGKIQEAESLYNQLEHQGRVNEITLTTMLGMYKEARSVGRALGMATRMLNMSYLQDIASYNSVLSLYASLGRATQAVEVFKVLETRNVSPNIWTYTIMAGVLKRIGSVQEAIDLLTTASSSGHSQSLESLTTLVSLYARAGLFEEAFKVCDKLRHSSFSLDAAAYNALIFAYGSAGRFDESLRMFMEMQSKGLEPDAVTYTTVITVYGKAGLLEGVTRIFKRMKQAGCEPSMATYNAVIDIYKNAGKVELGAMVYQEMKFTEYLRQQGNNH